MNTLAEWKVDGVEYRICKGEHTKPLLETIKRSAGYVESRIDDIEPTLAAAICKLVERLVQEPPKAPMTPAPDPPRKPRFNRR